MKYLDFINRFWTLHEDESFTTTEIALYFYLLRVANHGTFKIQFKRNNVKIGADLDLSYNTLCKSRNRLKQAKLIDFKTRNGDANVEYKLMTFSKNDEVSAEVSAEVPCEVSAEVPSEKRIDKDKDKDKKNISVSVSSVGQSKPDKPTPVGPALVESEFTNEQEREHWQGFMDWMKFNGITQLQKMQEPLTPSQLVKLIDKYGLSETIDVFQSMDNKRGLTKTYVSAYKTAANWLKRAQTPKKAA